MLKNFALASLFAAPLVAQPVAYLVDTSQDQLYSVDLTNGNSAVIGSITTVTTAADLAYREDTNTMWTIDLAGGEVGTIDLQTGAFTLVTNTGVSGWQGMAWDPFTKKFYLANQNDDMYSLDPVSGQLTTLGNSGFGLITCLDVDASGILWGIDFSSADIVQIDKVTGIATSVATTIRGFQGLGFDGDGRWFGVNTNDDSLYLIDPMTGTATLIGPNPGTTFAKGFEITRSAVLAGGTPCADGNGDFRRLSTTGSSTINDTLNVTMDAGSMQMPGALLFGITAQNLDLSVLGAPTCSLYSSGDFSVSPFVTGGTLPIPVPNQTSLIGAVLVIQGVVSDVSGRGNQLGIVTTDFLRVVVTN